MEMFAHTPLESGHNGLTGRTVNNLAKNGVATYGELKGLAPQQKLSLDGIGQQGRRQIDWIQEHVTVIFKPAEPVADESLAHQEGDEAQPVDAVMVDDRLAAEQPEAPPKWPVKECPACQGWKQFTGTCSACGGVGVVRKDRPLGGNKPDDEQSKLKYAGMSLGERIEQVRIARGYIQRVDTPQGTPFKKAVLYADLMRLMRPLCVDWGIRWKPVQSELISNDTFVRNDKTWFRTLVKVTVRFKRTEDPDPGLRSGATEYEDIEVIVEGMDNQDKAMNKAYTLADKIAIIRVFNLEYGDDADHTPLNLAPDVPRKNQECIDQIYALLAKDPEIDDPEAHLKAVAADYGRRISRRVINEYALPLAALEVIRNKLQDAAMDNQATKDNPGQRPVIDRAAHDLPEKTQPMHPPVDAAFGGQFTPPANITPAEQKQIDEMRGAAHAVNQGRDEITSELTPTGSEHIEIPEKDQAKASAAVAKMDARRAAETPESPPEAEHTFAHVDPPEALGAGEQDFLNLGEQPEYNHPSQGMGGANPF